MNNMTTGLKKLLTNKNTVTILGVVLAVVVLYAGYNWRVKAATNPIEVPYATKTISAGTEITEEAVGTINVPPAMLVGDVIRDRQNVIGKYAMADTVIPEGSLFYGRAVCEQEQLPASIILQYPKGYVLYYMSVNMETTYSNSIYPGNYIDVYLKASIRNQEGTGESKVTFGKLLENRLDTKPILLPNNNIYIIGTNNISKKLVPGLFFMLKSREVAAYPNVTCEIYDINKNFSEKTDICPIIKMNYYQPIMMQNNKILIFSELNLINEDEKKSYTSQVEILNIGEISNDIK